MGLIGGGTFTFGGGTFKLGKGGVLGETGTGGGTMT